MLCVSYVMKTFICAHAHAYKGVALFDKFDQSDRLKEAADRGTSQGIKMASRFGR